MGTIEKQDIATFTPNEILEARELDVLIVGNGLYEPAFEYVSKTKTEELFDRSACQDSPQLFYPFGIEPENPVEKYLREDKAKAICRGCAVIKLCNDYVIENPGVGVYAGMTEEERDRKGMPSLARNISSYNRGHAEKRWQLDDEADIKQ